jgi:hypothetical protein
VEGQAVSSSGCRLAAVVAALFLLGFACLAIVAWRTRHKGAFAPLATWFAAGCSLRLATLSRPSSQSVFALCLAALAALPLIGYVKPRLLHPTWLVSWRNTAAWALTCVVGVLVCVIPVAHHNASAGAGWVISTNNEQNLFLGNNPYTPNYTTWH